MFDNITISELKEALLHYRTRAQKAEDIVKLYNELIFAVEHKFTDETRHQTALRYITEREHGQDNSPAKENI